MTDDFVELHGDRLFGDDAAIVAGLARLDGRSVAVIGQQKGADTDENIRRNFGMPHPEGYRKAMRIMELAERFGLPVVTFVDVPGAHPGAESEERGIAEAIARSVALMTRLRTPIVTVITGEGGSGGALAIAVGDVVIALENAVYSVISPEGCASILWRTSDEAPAAAAAMRMTAADQRALGVIDIVVAEPGEGAHAEPAETARRLSAIVVDRLARARPRSRSTSSSRRATGATGRWGPTLRPSCRRSRRRSGRGLGDRLRDLLDPGRRAVGGADRSVVARRAAGPRGGLASVRSRPPMRRVVRGAAAARGRPRRHRPPRRRAAAGPDRQARRDGSRRARGPRGRLAGPAAPAGQRAPRQATASAERSGRAVAGGHAHGNVGTGLTPVGPGREEPRRS